MARWSRQQDEVLWEHGHEGAERCADIIGHRFGIARTAEAVRRHAYRIGAPMFRYEICPQCGGKFQYLGKSGVCNACRKRELAEVQRRRKYAIQAEMRVNHSSEYSRDAEREYMRERKAVSDLQKKLKASAT